MSDSEKLDLILSKMNTMESKMNTVESDIKELKTDVRDVQQKLTDTRLHLENVTDWNIKLLAENHSNLIDKLNQAIPAADKNLAYEVKVNFLVAEVDKLKKEVEDLKNKIA